jgi:hypothetical protein
VESPSGAPVRMFTLPSPFTSCTARESSRRRTRPRSRSGLAWRPRRAVQAAPPLPPPCIDPLPPDDRGAGRDHPEARRWSRRFSRTRKHHRNLPESERNAASALARSASLFAHLGRCACVSGDGRTRGADPLGRFPLFRRLPLGAGVRAKASTLGGWRTPPGLLDSSRWPDVRGQSLAMGTPRGMAHWSQPRCGVSFNLYAPFRNLASRGVPP